LRGLLCGLIALALAGPVGATPPEAVEAVDILSEQTTIPVAVVLGEHEDGLLALGGAVSRRFGVPEGGLELVWLGHGGRSRVVAPDTPLVSADLSARGDVAAVTVEGNVLVGPPGKLTRLDLGDLFVTQVRWDPWGDQLAVTAWAGGARPWDTTRAETLDDLGRAVDSDVYLVRPGGPPRRLTDGPKQDYNPVWSPDGHRLLFVSLRTGYASFFVAEAESGAATQLTNLGAEHGAPATPVALSDRCWWTDERIVYGTTDDKGAPQAWEMDQHGHAVPLDTGELRGWFGTSSYGLLDLGGDWTVLQSLSEMEGGIQP